MAHLFLDELREVFKGRLFWSLDRFNLSSFHRKDYHSPEKKDLADAVRSTMTEQLGYEVKGPVSIVTIFSDLVPILAWAHVERSWVHSAGLGQLNLGFIKRTVEPILFTLI